MNKHKKEHCSPERLEGNDRRYMALDNSVSHEFLSSREKRKMLFLTEMILLWLSNTCMRVRIGFNTHILKDNHLQHYVVTFLELVDLLLQVVIHDFLK